MLTLGHLDHFFVVPWDANHAQLASGYQNIFEKLLQAYARIAEALPQFDRFRTSFKGNAAFEAVLAMVFSDIAEFHRRAYKFFRRRGVTS
jgi:hypothetical protein